MFSYLQHSYYFIVTTNYKFTITIAVTSIQTGISVFKQFLINFCNVQNVLFTESILAHFSLILILQLSHGIRMGNSEVQSVHSMYKTSVKRNEYTLLIII